MAKRVLHISTGLGIGGAETMLANLLEQCDKAAWEARVLSLTDRMEMAPRLRDMGIGVDSLGMKRPWPNPFMYLRLVRYLKDWRPEIIQTWMYHADLLGGLAARRAGKIPAVWGIHHTNLDPAMNKRSTLWTMRLCARFSASLPRRIVCCSEATRALHIQAGYDASRMATIPNGFDMDKFKPDPAARDDFRREIGIDSSALLIGYIARFHPLKDHANFIRAAALLNRERPEVQFILAGKNITRDNATLMKWIRENGMAERFHLLGMRSDTPRIEAALDIGSLASRGEAFPLILGESMACGVPCVSTDVGDAALIVGDCGRIVAPENPEALAGGWRELLDMPHEARIELGLRARKRIQERFSISIIASRYFDLYQEILQK
ncbi:MAG: glycosyltransferase family 4 protein [Candidatus Sumerlaeia bacterium]